MPYPKQQAALARIYEAVCPTVGLRRRAVEIERLVDNCDGDIEALYEEWVKIQDRLEQSEVS